VAHYQVHASSDPERHSMKILSISIAFLFVLFLILLVPVGIAQMRRHGYRHGEQIGRMNAIDSLGEAVEGNKLDASDPGVLRREVHGSKYIIYLFDKGGVTYLTSRRVH
jgi:hypothetical protein